MTKIYLLNSNIDSHCFFMERNNDSSSFVRDHFKWKVYNEKTYSYELMNNNNRRNYQFDFSFFSGGVLILSERGYEVLKNIIDDSCTKINISTTSKMKNFYGFYPNKKIFKNNIVDLNKSDFEKYEKGILFRKIFLNSSAPINDYLFSIEDYMARCFVTDKFKKIVEDNGLVGFDFTEIVYEED